MVIPIEGQYEQQCNAAALEKVGVKKMAYLNESTKQEFFNWLKNATIHFFFTAKSYSTDIGIYDGLIQ
ncbi:MAG: hypothetical protein IPG18_04740 [Saprospiraceae bacterium]|nr:hypothetical protein [Saprospiraceae bacterium]